MRLTTHVPFFWNGIPPDCPRLFVTAQMTAAKMPRSPTAGSSSGSCSPPTPSEDSTETAVGAGASAAHDLADVFVDVLRDYAECPTRRVASP